MPRSTAEEPAIESRRTQIASLFLQGIKRQSEPAQRLGVDRSTVSRDLKVLNARWKEFQARLLLGVSASANSSAADQPEQSKRGPSVIAVDCHAGEGLNFTKGDPAADPWTTYNDRNWVLQQAE
jgi:hypothetical protein